MTTAASPPLSNLQAELLRLYANNVSEEDLSAIKRLISDFFAERTIQAADKTWHERSYSNQTMDEWLKGDLRKR